MGNLFLIEICLLLIKDLFIQGAFSLRLCLYVRAEIFSLVLDLAS